MYEILFIFSIPIKSLTQTNSNPAGSSSIKQNLLALSVGVSVLDLDLVTNTYKSKNSLIYPTRNNSFGVWELYFFFELTPWRVFSLLNFDQKSKNLFNYFLDISLHNLNMLFMMSSLTFV